MAQILIKGPMATVELIEDPGGWEGGVLARCIEHSTSDGNCSWTASFSDWNNAVSTPFIEAHADEGEQR